MDEDQKEDLQLTDVTFSLGGESLPVLSDVFLTTDSVEEILPCQVIQKRIACENIPEAMGVLTNGKRTLTLTGSVPEVQSRPVFHVFIENSGGPDTPGSVRWTDGTTQFEWLSLDAPVVGTTFK